MSGGPDDLAAEAGVLARGLSGGRRREARLSIGEAPAFWTDLADVFVPWPLPNFATAPGALAVAIGLQVAPSKEIAARLLLKRPYPRLVIALRAAEAEAALGWLVEHWPGLGDRAVALAGGLVPARWEDLTPETLIERAERRGRDLRAVPEVFGRLLLRSTDGGFFGRMSQLAALRLPKRLDDQLDRLGDRLTVEFDVFDAEADRADDRVAGAIDADRAVWRPDTSEGIPYPEWDCSTQSYREDWVTVIERDAESSEEPPGPPRPDLESWFSAPLDRRWQGRLVDGPDLDIDAVVDALSDLAAGEGASDRVYRDRLRTERNLASAILIDASGSLAHGALIDYELELADALVDAMHRARERHAVFAFSSHGREAVVVETLQDFDQPARRPSTQAVRPRGQTRLGAAVRHVTARLARQPVERRALIVLSDCAPFDDDYEGVYADADLLKALDEADEAGVVVAVIGVGESREDPLQQALGDRLCRVEVLDDLAPALAQAHARLIA